MRIIEWPEFIAETPPPEGPPLAVTVGIFDGVHRGHKALIEEVVSQKERAVPAVITFKQGHHKKALGGWKEYPGDILSFRQKMAVFESLGVALTIVVDFSESFRKMSGVEFLRILGESGSMRFMAVGSNFRCGYRLDTDAFAIKIINGLRNIHTSIVPPLTECGKPISSSQIRTAITHGKLREAAAMLGRPFVVDLSGEGSVLPPPGKYQVLLRGKDPDQGSGTPAEIRVEKGNILIGEDAAKDSANGGVSYEYVEFLC